MLWLLCRSFFLWLPPPLYLLVRIAFFLFTVFFIVKLLKLIWDAIPFL